MKKQAIMKKLLLIAVIAYILPACSSSPAYDSNRISVLLEKQAGWTAAEYADMFDQLRAATERADHPGDMSEAELVQIHSWISDMNFYMIEALNDGLLDPSTASSLREWLSDD